MSYNGGHKGRTQSAGRIMAQKRGEKDGMETQQRVMRWRPRMKGVASRSNCDAATRSQHQGPSRDVNSVTVTPSSLRICIKEDQKDANMSTEEFKMASNLESLT